MSANKRGVAGTLGILGGGQLGRMTIQAAQALGWRGHVFCPEADTPAAQVADGVTQASYTDRAALADFAKAVDVITYEFENIPLESIDFLSAHRPVRPGRQALEVSQDRIREKAFLNAVPGVATARYQPVRRADELDAAATAVGYPSILKSARYGYDGKGQVRIGGPGDLATAWDSMPHDGGAVLEAVVDYEREISVIIARGVDGTMRGFDAAENSHVDHILDISRAPAALSPALAETADTMGRDIARRLDLIGLLAVEMFVTRDGGVLVNEIAPRPHNSGHWTMDGCEVSQFDQFVLAVTGAALGDPARRFDVDMKNLIGAEFDRRHEIAQDHDVIHVYGKKESRPGRKMGHINRPRPMGTPATPFAPARHHVGRA